MLEETNLLNYLVSFHSTQYSLLDQKIKNSINSLIFDLFDAVYFGQEEFDNKIATNCFVYCYTRDSIKKLIKMQQTGQQVILCTSLCSDAYNHKSTFSNYYNHKYKFRIKENCYGIKLNAIGKHNHENEQEVLVKLDSIDLQIIEELKL